MKLEDLDLEMMPTNNTFVRLVEREECRLEFYNPSFIELEIPLGHSWWALMYWIPKMKKEIYRVNLIAGERGVTDLLYNIWGIDEKFFKRHYGFFLKRLKWMRQQNKANHLGEL